MKLKLPHAVIDLAMRVFDVEASFKTSQLRSRAIEYAYAAERAITCGRGRVLDVGCTSSLNYLPVVLAFLGFKVVGTDLRPFLFAHPNFEFAQADIRHTSLASAAFDIVCAVSTLEHIGLSGRYGVDEEDEQGDAKAIREIWRLLRPGGAFIITVPFGQWQVVKPLLRVYDSARLRQLLEGWRRVHEVYYYRDKTGLWTTGAADQVETMTYAKGHGLALLHLEKV